jgi:hypothetical protein
MTAPRPTARGVDPAEQLTRYEQWKTHLEGVRADYVRRTVLYRRGYLALTAAGFACFAFGRFPGIWGAGCATVVSVCGYAMLYVRVWELDVEIGEMRDEIKRVKKLIGGG